jgi:hypothetical protein
MTPERYQKYLATMTKHTPPELAGHALAEKQSEVIVTMGEKVEVAEAALTAAQAETEAVKAQLRDTEAKLFKARNKVKGLKVKG